MDNPKIPERKRVTHRPSGKSQTDQTGRKVADINVLVAQYQKNGTFPVVSTRSPLYGDFTGPEDLHSAREQAFAAHERFMELPVSVRKLAKHDEVEFLRMFEDPAQRVLLEEAGLTISDNPNDHPNPNPSPSLSEGGKGEPGAPPTTDGDPTP